MHIITIQERCKFSLNECGQEFIKEYTPTARHWLSEGVTLAEAITHLNQNELAFCLEASENDPFNFLRWCIIHAFIHNVRLKIFTDQDELADAFQIHSYYIC